MEKSDKVPLLYNINLKTIIYYKLAGNFCCDFSSFIAPCGREKPIKAGSSDLYSNAACKNSS